MFTTVDKVLGTQLNHKHRSSDIFDFPALDTRYLKLDASNGPITGSLLIQGHGAYGGGAGIDVASVLSIGETLNSASVDVFGLNLSLITTAATTHQVIGLQFVSRSSISSGTIGVLGGMFGGARTTLGENITVMYGGFFQPVHAGTGTVDSLRGIASAIQNISTGTITTGYGFLIGQAVNSGGGTISTQYGLFIDNQDKGSTNYSIFTGTGLVHFGDNAETNGNFYVPYGNYFSVDRASNWPSGTHKLIGVNWNGSADQTEIYTPGSVRSTPMLLLTADAKMSFFNHSVSSQQTVTGSRGANAALASLLTALANYGLIIDSSS